MGNKSLTRVDIEPVISKMQDHLIAKNVAADVAAKLCESVANNLEGKVLGRERFFMTGNSFAPNL